MNPKSGAQSTEFLLTLLTGAVVVLSGLDYISIDPGLLQTFVGANIAYIAQRGWVKGKASDAARERRSQQRIRPTPEREEPKS